MKTVNVLMEMNRKWFEHHKHLSTEEMLKRGLIDECDREWVEILRDEERKKG